MKKVVSLLLCLCLVLSIPILALADQEETAETFMSVNDFNLYFNVASALTKSGHKITSDNIELISGPIRDCFVITLIDNVLILHVYMPHIEEYNGKPNDINEIDLVFFSDGTEESVYHMVFAVSELALTTGAITKIEETGDFINELGFLDNVEDGAENTITVDDLDYTYQISSLFGFHFSVLKAQPEE